MAAKSIEELKSLIKDPQILEDIVDSINAEKEKGISEKSKANKEAQNLRKFKTAVEAIGYGDSDDLDSFVSSIIKVKNKKPEENTLTLKTLNEQIESLKTELNSARNKSKHDKIKAKLTEALSDKILGSKYIVDSLVSSNSVDIDGDDVIFKYDGSVVSFQEGIKKVMEDNKDLIKSSLKNGNQTTQGVSHTPTDVSSVLQSNDPTVIKQNIDKVKEWLKS